MQGVLELTAERLKALSALRLAPEDEGGAAEGAAVELADDGLTQRQLWYDYADDDSDEDLSPGATG